MKSKSGIPNVLSTQFLELEYESSAICKSNSLDFFQELNLEGGECENAFFALLVVFVEDNDRRDAVIETGLGLRALEQVAGHAAGEAETLGEASVAPDAVLGLLDDLGGRRFDN